MLRRSDKLLFTGRSGLAAIDETRLGKGFEGASPSELSSEVTAADTIEGADPSEEAIDSTDGKGVGGSVGSRGALLIGNG
jgi:hypothetical protein